MPNIILKNTDCLDALIRCQSVVAANPSPIVLKYCRLRCTLDDRILEIQATDGDVDVSHTIDIEPDSLFEEDFDVLIDPRTAVPLMPAIKSDSVNLLCEPDISKVTISGGGNKFELLSQPADEFPKFLFSNKSTGIKVSAGIVKKMLSSALVAIDKNSSKVAMTAALFEYEIDSEGKKILYVVGASGQMVIFSIYDCDLGDKPFTILVPHNAISPISKVLEDMDDLELTNNQEKDKVRRIFFETQKAKIGCAPIAPDYKYPPWDRIVPGGVKEARNVKDLCQVSVPTELFREYIVYAQTMSDKEYNLIHITFQPDSMNEHKGYILLNSQSEAGNASVAPIEAQVIRNGKAFDEYVSSKYLISALDVLTGSEILITRDLSKGSSSPMRFDSASYGSDVFVGAIVSPIDKQKLEEVNKKTKGIIPDTNIIRGEKK